MVSAFTHAASAVALGTLFPRDILPRRVWILGALAAALPDLDAILHWSGVPYSHPFGHRGFTHSLAFAVLLAGAVTLATARASWRGRAGAVFAYLALCTASHGFFDAMTDGGMGIAFFAPFHNARYFLPWDPIHVAPIGIRAFFTEWGWRVFQSELLWVWLPCFSLALMAWAWRVATRALRSGAATQEDRGGR